MPLFNPEEISALVRDHTDSADTLDLRGASAVHTVGALTRMLEHRCFGDTTSVSIRIDPATPTSGETLFLPLGRHLLAARKRGLVLRFHLLRDANGSGFYVELPAHSKPDGFLE